MKRQKKYNQIKDVTDNIRIAIYMRISKIDSNEKVQEESNSISMQRILIKKYITSHFISFQIVEYKDMKLCKMIQLELA